MPTLKRSVVWLLERLMEACTIGFLFVYFVRRIPSDVSGSGSVAGNSLASDVWVGGIVIAALLFVHGYYVTTAIFGMLWRSPKPWVYPTIAAALFVFHTHIIFLRGKADFTPEARTLELPLLVCGSAVVFACSFAGNEALKRWTAVQPSSNPYLSAGVVTLFSFLLLNTANYLRPVVGSFSFRPYGLPFTFYREGGYVQEWVWRDGIVVWRGLMADLLVVAAVIALTGKAVQRVRG